MNTDTAVLASIHHWDVRAFQRILQTHKYKLVVDSAYWTSRLADGWLYPLVAALIFSFGFDPNLTLTTTLFVAFSLERSVYLIAKKGFKRKRPANVIADFRSIIIASDEFSFPSGHTSGAFLFVTVLMITQDSTYGLLYSWALAVGLSRVILGVHFPTDILMGALLGSGAAVLATTIVATT